MKIKNNINIKSAFFGSSDFSVYVLDILAENNMLPDLIVTTPDKPKGRGLKLTPTPVKIWAQKHNILCKDPAKLKDFQDELGKENWDLFLVASYGKIMPESIIYLPKYKSINVHPSLLPQYRGPSPLQTMILDDCKTTGISIMLMDKDMDHGDILCQKVIDIKEWMPYEDFELFMAKEGGRMLIDTIPQWIKNKIEPKKQDHDKASFTKKIEKENGLMDIFTASQYDIYRKYCAFHIWPSVYFEISAEGGPYRIKIKDALWKDGKLIIKKVVRENGKEISYSDFILSLENDGCLHEDQKAILRQYSAFE